MNQSQKDLILKYSKKNNAIDHDLKIISNKTPASQWTVDSQAKITYYLLITVAQ